MSKETPATRVDPLKAWREWFVQSEREWSEALTRLMKEDATARAVGQEINAALYAQQMLKQGMAGSLTMMNMPTQDQLTALSERIGSLEDAVARVEASFVQLRHTLDAAAPARPARNRGAAPGAGREDASGTRSAPAKPARKQRA